MSIKKLTYFLFIISVIIFGIFLFYFRSNSPLSLTVEPPKNKILPEQEKGDSIPSEKDYFFQVVAEDFNAPQLCEKISEKSFGTAGFGGNNGFAIWYIKSECYYDLVAKYQDFSLCSKVKENKSNPFLDGSHFSQSYCLKLSPPINKDAVRLYPDRDFLVKILNYVGYTDNTVVNSSLETNNLAITYYSKLNNTSEFLDRTEKLPNYNEPYSVINFRTANPNEYLYERVAIETKNPEFCKKISPNAKFIIKNGGSTDPADSKSLRDKCFGSIAIETNAPSLCNSINNTSKINYVIFEQHGYPKQECIDIIYNNYKKPRDLSGCDDKTTFDTNEKRDTCRSQLSTIKSIYEGYVDFPSLVEMTAALKNLGYDPALEVSSTDYSNFYRGIRDSSDPVLRNEFIRKIEGIPDSFR